MKDNEYSLYKSLHHQYALKNKIPVLCYFFITHKCNNKCPTCSSRYGQKFDENIEMPIEDALPCLIKLKELGLKAISLSGGEPLMHSNFGGFIRAIIGIGLDIAVITNGRLLSKKYLDVLKWLSWIRVSINAVNPDIYKLVHGAKMPERYFLNLKETIPKLRKYGVTTGASFLINKNNIQDMLDAVIMAKEIGFETFRFNYTRDRDGLIFYKDEDLYKIKDNLSIAINYSCDSFRVLPLSDRLLYKISKPYTHCYQSDISLCITADGGVYACPFLANNPRAFYGSIYEKSIDYIWLNKKEIDVTKCPICWQTKKNEFMAYLMSKPTHVNFV